MEKGETAFYERELQLFFSFPLLFRICLHLLLEIDFDVTIPVQSLFIASDQAVNMCSHLSHVEKRIVQFRKVLDTCGMSFYQRDIHLHEMIMSYLMKHSTSFYFEHEIIGHMHLYTVTCLRTAHVDETECPVELFMHVSYQAELSFFSRFGDIQLTSLFFFVVNT